MRPILLLFFNFFTFSLFSQDSLVITKVIDSIWINKPGAKKQNFKGESPNIYYRVFYEKKTREVLLVTVSCRNVPDEETKTWIYNYHFRDGKLIFFTKYNNAGVGDSRRKVCYYYFREDTLLYRHEYRTSVPDISAEQQKAYLLKQRFTKN